MGFSIAVMAYALEDKDTVLGAFGWSVSDRQVGVPVNLEEVSWEVATLPEFQASNDPHFSAALGEQHFFIYTTFAGLGRNRLDFEALSGPAPMTVLIVVETSEAGTVEHWQNGKRVWTVGGADNQEFEIEGEAPVDLNALANDYRSEYRGMRGLPDSNEALIRQAFLSLVNDWFANETGFRYAGDHPPLYRMNGELPVKDSRAA